jgi:hypothetical protein
MRITGTSLRGHLPEEHRFEIDTLLAIGPPTPLTVISYTARATASTDVVPYGSGAAIPLERVASRVSAAAGLDDRLSPSAIQWAPGLDKSRQRSERSDPGAGLNLEPKARGHLDASQI